MPWKQPSNLQNEKATPHKRWLFTGIVESIKSQNPSTKLGPHPGGGDSEGEITNKSQIPILVLRTPRPAGGSPVSMTKTGLGFGILVIVICLIFVICDLEFLFLQYYTTQILPRHHRGLGLPA
jgi:hypothetical protein